MKLRAFLDRIDWRLVFAFPLATAVVHLIATFAAMNDTSASAYAQLAGALPVNTMSVLETVAPDRQPLPFVSSDARYAICPFDTSEGKLDVRAELPNLGWTIGVYTADGASAYFAAAEPGRRTSVSVVVVPEDDRFLGVSPQAIGKAPSTEPQLMVAARKGIVVVRAPDRGAPYKSADEVVLAKASCARSKV